jgi:hypothetical protein
MLSPILSASPTRLVSISILGSPCSNNAAGGYIRYYIVAVTLCHLVNVPRELSAYASSMC